jgi:hypothetical protein
MDNCPLHVGGVEQEDLMKRFLMFVGVALVAAAMYVAASPASQQSRGPTAKQFKALKKQVSTLSKTLKQVKAEADASVTIIGACYLHDNGDGTASFLKMPVSRLASSTAGYLFGAPGANPSTSPIATTALDEVTSSPQAYLQEVDPQCATTSFLRHAASRSDSSRVLHWAERTR